MSPRHLLEYQYLGLYPSNFDQISVNVIVYDPTQNFILLSKKVKL